MKFQETLDARGLAGAEVVVGQPAEHLCEIRDSGVTNDLQRVMIPERGTPEGLAAHEDGQRRGRMRIDQAHCLNIVHPLATESG